MEKDRENYATDFSLECHLNPNVFDQIPENDQTQKLG